MIDKFWLIVLFLPALIINMAYAALEEASCFCKDWWREITTGDGL